MFLQDFYDLFSMFFLRDYVVDLFCCTLTVFLLNEFYCVNWIKSQFVDDNSRYNPEK